MPFDSASYLQARLAGSDALARGISGAASSIADAITQAGANHRRLKAMQSSAVDIMGMDKDEVSKMSVDDLEQHMHDVVLKSALDDSAAKRQAMLAKEDVNWADLQPHEFTTSSGMRGVYGKGGQFQFDPGQFMNDTTPPEGYSVVAGPHGPQYLRKPADKSLPASYDTRLSNTAGNGLVDQLAEAQAFAGKSDDDLLAMGSIKGDRTKLAARRAANQKQIDGLQTQIKNHMDSYRSRYPEATDWAGEYTRYNLPAPAASESTPAAVSAAGTKGAPASASVKRVRVADPSGKQFDVPESQLQAAIAQGYTQVK